MFIWGLLIDDIGSMGSKFEREHSALRLMEKSQRLKCSTIAIRDLHDSPPRILCPLRRREVLLMFPIDLP